MARPVVEVVHIGAASRDIAIDDPRGWRLGGGVTYAALTSARLGLRTAAYVGVDAEAADARELDELREAGVELRLVVLAEGPVFVNEETPEGRIQTAVHAGVPLPIPAIPGAWRDAPGWSIVPVAGETTDAWADLVPEHAHCAVAWQGSLRHLVSGRHVTRQPPRPSPILARADLIGVSRDDLAPNTRTHDLWRPLHPGADLLITDGLDGGRLLHLGSDGPEAVLRYRAVPAAKELDPTGAGDVFLAALQATILRPDITGRGPIGGRADLAFAAAAASLVVEGLGTTGVPTLAAVRSRDAAVGPVEDRVMSGTDG